MFGFGDKKETPDQETNKTAGDAAQQSHPAARLKAELEALGCTVEFIRTTAVTVAYDGGDIGGTFTVHVVGDVGNDEAAEIIARAKKDLPLGRNEEPAETEGETQPDQGGAV